MRIQRVTRTDGVREECSPGVGATYPSGVSASADAALVAPTPGTTDIQNVSVTDTKLICARYKPDQLSIRR